MTQKYYEFKVTFFENCDTETETGIVIASSLAEATNQLVKAFGGSNGEEGIDKLTISQFAPSDDQIILIKPEILDALRNEVIW